MNSKGKIYFVSDLHLGVPDPESTREREAKFVRWLTTIQQDAAVLFLLGDIFDFWYEYKRVVPKGYVRLLGKLAELSDQGIEIHYFTGNHDLWMFGYFEQELGIEVHRRPEEKVFFGKRFFIGHGDGLGPGDKKYKLLLKLFENRTAQWFFSRLHPNFAMGLADYFSKKSRLANAGYDEVFDSEEKEILLQFAREHQKTHKTDYYIFGHRHLPLDLPAGNARYINLGEWVTDSPYAVFDGDKLLLKKFEG